MLLNKYFIWRALVNPKTKSCTTALIMQPPTFSYSFNYSRFTAGQTPVLLGLLLLHCGYCSMSPPHISLFFSGQAVHLTTEVGQGETGSFETQDNPTVILKRIQRKKYFERHSRVFVFPLHTAPYRASSQSLPSPWLPPSLLPINPNSGKAMLITCLCWQWHRHCDSSSPFLRSHLLHRTLRSCQLGWGETEMTLAPLGTR